MKALHAIPLLLCLASGGLAQNQAPAPTTSQISPSEAMFYEAFWLDQGAARPQRAIALYEKFLNEHPDHRFASRAARFALDALLRTKKSERAKIFRERHARLLEASVKPGINSGYRDPNLDAKQMVARFEGESREVFLHRGALAKILALRPGMHVADIGAGTGLFTFPMARAVGEEGKVYAVDISDGMLAHLEKEKARRKMPGVEVVACNERSSCLKPASCDLVWICDTYHHFEFPQATLASIHAALRPGGELVIVDFERIPGVSREWILGHVRAGKDEVRKEIEGAGFRFVREEKTPLKENYFVRFVKD